MRRGEEKREGTRREIGINGEMESESRESKGGGSVLEVGRFELVVGW